jgi:hypothetical protein
MRVAVVDKPSRERPLARMSQTLEMTPFQRVDWQTLAARQSPGGGVYRFTDSTSTNHIQRFYQVH